jgi:hypothetical protein
MLRVSFLVVTLMLTTSTNSNQQRRPAELMKAIDHLVYATPDLGRAVDQFEKLTGVRATPGGQHPGRGTRNALVALGPTSYLEIIGPDPDQPPPATPRQFGIDGLKDPRLATWVAKGTDLVQLREAAVGNGIQLGPVVSGRRNRPDGVTLSWRATDSRAMPADGIVPFFIDWGESPHPSATAARGLTLVELRAEHPEAERVQEMLRKLGLDLQVKRGARAALIAVIETPRGRVELR